ncbi:carotenoid ester lipase precursor [Mycena galericulata]|nr:carotenoid ester lipase precursor [Mycena galericulata]
MLVFKLESLTLLFRACATVGASLDPPTVTLDAGTFTGVVGSANTHSFLGLPFARPPVGDLRFRLPVTIPAYTGSHTATEMGLACPQQAFDIPILTGLPQEVVKYLVNSIYGQIYPDSEDCLTLNVIKPMRATAPPELPVVVWFFASGFEFGSPSMSDGSAIVERSIAMGEPVIYVSMNYRVSAFGFLAGAEVKAAGVGNLGLQDQREALRWVQKYIAAFGGDPTKVTIWGESAGAISVSLQMLANGGNTEGLFRAAFMQSGAPIPVGSIVDGQKYYDAIVNQTGCSGAADTLACLRTVPYATLKAAQNASPGIFSYQSLVLAWLPRADGVFLSDNPQRLVQQGLVAQVPFVTGSCDDEGTIFSLSTTNITTGQEFTQWVQTYWASEGTTAHRATLDTLYPCEITQGSPFDTGMLDALTPQFKRIASFQGDSVFQAPRRFLQQTLSGRQNQWAYLSKRGKDIPFLGSFHTSDTLFDGELTDYLINFATNLDPNGNTVPSWPAYTSATPNMLTFRFVPSTEITQDTYRAAGMQS